MSRSLIALSLLGPAVLALAVGLSVLLSAGPAGMVLAPEPLVPAPSHMTMTTGELSEVTAQAVIRSIVRLEVPMGGPIDMP